MDQTNQAQPNDVSLDPSQTQAGNGVDTSSQPNAGVATSPTAGQFVPRERLNEEIAKRRLLEEQLQKQNMSGTTQPTQPSVPQDADRVYARTVLGIDADLERLRREAAEEARKAAAEAAHIEAEKTRTDMWLQSEEQRLKTKYDGNDGVLPPFDVKEVLAHGAQRGIYDLESAYRDKYFDKFVEKAKYDNQNQTTSVEKPGFSAANFKPVSQDEFNKMTPEEMEKYLPHE